MNHMTDNPTAAAKADAVQDRAHDATIRIAGNSQDGIQSVGAMLARLAGRSRMDVMAYMTIPATTSGGPSIFQVHMSSDALLAICPLILTAQYSKLIL